MVYLSDERMAVIKNKIIAEIILTWKIFMVECCVKKSRHYEYVPKYVKHL